MAAPKSELVKVTAAQVSFHSGPIPDPATLRQYEEIHAGAAGRILGMAEKQSSHRQAIELKRVNADGRAEFLGQIMAFLLAAGAMYCGYNLLLQNKPIAGFTLLLGPLAGLVLLFLLKRKDAVKAIAAKPKA